jgi:predicted ATP-grasp superfamily ATP-dependent carboligase
MSKSVQCQIAEQCGLSIPQSICTNDPANLGKWNVFPCIIKPSESINGSKSDIKICHNFNELEHATREFQGKEFQVQQFIEKDTEFQLIGCSLTHGKNVTIPGYTSIIRQPDNTNTGYLLYKGADSFISDSFLEKVKKFIQAIGYEGLFSVEFLRDKKGQDFFLEINMRNDGNAFCVTVAGVNLPYLWYQNGIGVQVTENTKKIRPVHFMPEIEDLREAVHQKVGLFNWFRQLLKTEAHAVFYFKDPAPFLYKSLAEAKRLFNKNIN